MSQFEIYAILNDIHFPFECKRRWKIAVELIKAAGVSHIFLNGDIGEFQGVSSWPVHPNDKGLNLFAELNYLNKKFDELCEIFPDIPVTYICGNHEYRLFRFIRDTAPHLWGIMPDCPTLLQFEKRPYWKFVDYTNDQLVRCGKANLFLRHEPLGGGKNCAKSTAENSYVDVGFGHTHAYQVHTHRKFGPSPYVVKAYSLGFLGDKSRHVFDYRGPKDNWTEGFTLVEASKETGAYSLDFINLSNLPILHRGNLIG
jgi:predicted phosphodiesterase